MDALSAQRSHDGIQHIVRHASRSTGTDMTLGVFVPPGDAPAAGWPAVTFLSGLTCTHANVVEKGEYRAAAAALGLVVVAPDTSPRGDGVPDANGMALGQGASFYLDATHAPWAGMFHVEHYVVDELPDVVGELVPLDPARQGVTGHSMGGHGALTLALRHPGRWRSVSAIAPICAPTECPWGREAFAAYLGNDEAEWARHDACRLIEDGARVAELLVDQGEADPFLHDQLKPHRLEAACAAAGVPLTLRRHAGYDHSYFFVSTVLGDHLRWHSDRLT